MIMELGGTFPYRKGNLATSWSPNDIVRLKKAKLLYYAGKKKWMHELGAAMEEVIWYDKEYFGGYWEWSRPKGWLIKLPTMLREENVNGFIEGDDIWN